METNKKILTAIDFDEQSLIAFKYAKYFAETLNYELVVMTVIEESSFFAKLMSSDDMVVKINKEAELKLKEIAGSSDKINITTRVEHGKAHEKIISVADEISPALIFMGKSELPKYKRPFIGSNSLHVMLESSFPVITIRGNYDFETYKNEHKEILVPLDFGSETSEQITAGIEFAKIFNTGLRIITIQCEGAKGEEMKLLSYLGKTKDAVEAAGIKCEQELVHEEKRSVADVITEKALEYKSSMIVIMTRKENRFSDYVLGSNARDIINNSDIPVLSVQPWDAKSGSKLFSFLYDPLNVY